MPTRPFLGHDRLRDDRSWDVEVGLGCCRACHRRFEHGRERRDVRGIVRCARIEQADVRTSASRVPARHVGGDLQEGHSQLVVGGSGRCKACHRRVRHKRERRDVRGVVSCVRIERTDVELSASL